MKTLLGLDSKVIRQAYFKGLKDGVTTQAELTKNYLANTASAKLAFGITHRDNQIQTLKETYLAKQGFVPNTIKYLGESLANSPIVKANDAVQKACNEHNLNTIA